MRTSDRADWNAGSARIRGALVTLGRKSSLNMTGLGEQGIDEQRESEDDCDRGMHREMDGTDGQAPSNVARRPR